MKSLLLIILLASNLSAFAETYICEVEGTDQTISFGLKKELPALDGWDTRGIYKLSIHTTELAFADHEEEGIVNTGDVYFSYESKTTGLKFSMYLDENESVDFTLKGKKYSFSDCQYYDFNQQ